MPVDVFINSRTSPTPVCPSNDSRQSSNIAREVQADPVEYTEGVRNLDEEDLDDPLMIAEYANEVLEPPDASPITLTADCHGVESPIKPAAQRAVSHRVPPRSFVYSSSLRRSLPRSLLPCPDNSVGSLWHKRNAISSNESLSLKPSLPSQPSQPSCGVHERECQLKIAMCRSICGAGSSVPPLPLQRPH